MIRTAVLVRLERLRRDDTGKWLDELGNGWHWASHGRGCRPHDRARFAGLIRGDARAQRLEADTAVTFGL